MVVYHPSGRLALPGSGRLSENPVVEGSIVRMVDPETGEFDRPFLGGESPILFVAFSGNGRRLVSASRAIHPRPQENAIRIWRVANRKLIAFYDLNIGGGPLNPSSRVTSLAASPNNRFFAYGLQDGTVVVARMPLHIHRVERRGAETVIEWDGAGGPYQLQRCTDLRAGVWEDMGAATMAESATNATAASVFYRVQDLSNE